MELRQVQVCPLSGASVGGAPPLRLECKASRIWSLQATGFSKSNVGRGLESGRLLRDVGFDRSLGDPPRQRAGTGEMHWSPCDWREQAEDGDGTTLSQRKVDAVGRCEEEPCLSAWKPVYSHMAQARACQLP